MTKKFYHHLIAFEEIVALVGNKKEALALIENILHTHILDEILTHLPRHHHESFLLHLKNNPADKKLLKFLKKEAREDIEDVLAKRARKVKKKLLVEIKKSK